jgi:hypothetical protein
MLKLDIQRFADGEAEVMTYDEAYYIDLGTSETPNIQLMNVGITQLNESSNPIEKSTQYIGDKAVSNKVTGYDNQFPITSDLIKNNAVVEALYDVFRQRKTGADAKFDFYIVELWNETTTSGTYQARKIEVSAVIESKEANPGETITFSGNLKGIGDFKYGTFATATKTFTENA